ncbi:MAG: glucose 1-dehydrogenase [Acidimicrobiia bacterium]|nr:glucose 1-dehydrogenase [Acidimicrobiia bacterium]MDH4364210.1 glucose 1-dehydrogenase [Acidimicrobiia bacterium]MDH5289750.1 glucose 1-dehydrogenase [Acidimicrobiia bacterium]
MSDGSGNGQLASKVAVITGAASGMGLATAERFVAEGAKVVIADFNAEAGRAAAEALGPSARFTRCDVSVEDDVAAAVALATDAFGRLDVMFNNAGIGGAFGPITEIEVDHWDATFAVLVRGVFLGTKHAARVLIEQGQGGSIINTASVAGLGGGAGPQAYSAAKAAVVNLTTTTALELAPHSIRVNAICPGVIFTPLMHGGDVEDAEAMVSELQPLPKRGEGADIAGAALWLAGDDSAFVSGQSIAVDGALLAAGPRIFGRLKNTRNVHRMVGMAHGTTGQAPVARRL